MWDMFSASSAAPTNECSSECESSDYSLQGRSSSITDITCDSEKYKNECVDGTVNRRRMPALLSQRLVAPAPRLMEIKVDWPNRLK